MRSPIPETAFFALKWTTHAALPEERTPGNNTLKSVRHVIKLSLMLSTVSLSIASSIKRLLKLKEEASFFVLHISFNRVVFLISEIGEDFCEVGEDS